MRAHLFVALTLTACPSSEYEWDMSQRLSPVEARAGIVTSDDALFGGVSAEGRIGDFKIYNNRAQFIIQGFREGNYYLPHAGTIVDVDWVRPEGQLGHDPIDEWTSNSGVGRLLDAQTVEIIQPGGLNQAAIIRASGPEVGMGLLEQAIESPGFIPNLSLWTQTDYILEPNSPLLKVVTTVTPTRGDILIAPGDLMLASQEVGSTWTPGSGLQLHEELTKEFMAYEGNQNQISLGIFPEKGMVFEASGMDVFAGLLDLASAFYGAVEIPQGTPHTWTRYYGVGPDLATLTDEWHAKTGVNTTTVNGSVTAPDGPVPGARVNILLDDSPYTVAITDENGSFHATIPTDREVSLRADGHGRPLFTDLPLGSGPYSPYMGELQKTGALNSYQDGAAPWPQAVGRGVATTDEPLVLGKPAQLTLTDTDGLPFQVVLDRTDGRVVMDNRLTEGLDGRYEAAGWSLSGELTLTVEPGEYNVMVQRGIRFETFSTSVSLNADQPKELTFNLPKAYDHPGWLVGDPHCHASPSPDGKISMEERLAVQAGLGIQLHFGTDHDHIADYRPLVDALGLNGTLNSVVASEISPVLRGHLNAYPLTPVADELNSGAYPWWLTPVANTSEMFDNIYTQLDDFVLQVNHPFGFGIGDASKWSPGNIGSSSYWDDRFQAMEVLNSGHAGEYVNLYFDLVQRGYPVTPVGVSDSHSHLSGGQGYNVTFLHFGFDDPSLLTDELLKDTFRNQRTIVSRGPYLDLSVTPGSVVSSNTSVEVKALSPSWIVVDRIKLLENGIEIEVIEGSEATFQLAPDNDALYNIIAEGDTPMLPVTDATPWALSAPIYVDTDGDGWTPPLPPLTIKE